MVKHIVLWSFQDGIDKDDWYQKLNEMFNALIGEIPGMHSLTFNRGFDGYDICLETTHDDRAALDAYQSHPAHTAIKPVIAAIRKSRASCDYEI